MLGGASMESHMQQNQDIFLSSTSFLLLEHSPVFTFHLTVAVLRLQMCTTASSFFTWFLGIQLKSVAPEPSRSLAPDFSLHISTKACERELSAWQPPPQVCCWRRAVGGRRGSCGAGSLLTFFISPSLGSSGVSQTVNR